MPLHKLLYPLMERRAYPTHIPQTFSLPNGEMCIILYINKLEKNISDINRPFNLFHIPNSLHIQEFP